MILKRFYDEPLAQASYLVGCQKTGEALVVDALRDVRPYLKIAREEGLTITHVAETHIHADFVSGSRELAARTGAKLFLSNEGGPGWSYAFAEPDEAVLLVDGDEFLVGEVRVSALHTPGHTPEHLSFLVTDTASADGPMGIFSGDFLFVGDVGRPDLLERAAKVEGSMVVGARDLFMSLRRLEKLDDWLQIWPGHGAGSACGKGIGAVPTSTLGYERRFNWAFSYDEEDAFVEAVLQGQPDPPPYFAEMKRINKEGPILLGAVPAPRMLRESRLAEIVADEGATVVDTRSGAEYGSAHVPGTINLPLNRSFTGFAGWTLSYRRDLYLIVEDDRAGAEAVRDLMTIGLDRVAGLFPATSIEAWSRAAGSTEAVGSVSTSEAAELLESGDAEIIDVRWQDEWDGGHIPGASHIPMGNLEERIDEVPLDREIIVHCAGGPRARIAASLLQANGIERVSNLEGGFDRWRSEGRRVERPDAT